MKSFFQIRKDYHQPHTNSMLHTFLGSLMAPSVGQNLLGIFHAQQIWHHQHLFLFLEDSGLCIRNQWEKYCPEMNTNQMHCKIYLALKNSNHSTSEKKDKKEKTDINETRCGLPCHKVPQSDDKLPHLSQTVNQQSDQFPIDWCSQASGNEYVYDTGKKTSYNW